MKENEEIIYRFFNKIIGLKAENVMKGYGTFICIDFGKKIKEQFKLWGKWRIDIRGEWHLWTMGLWKIYKKNSLIACCEDTDEKIEKALEKMDNKKLTNVELLNNAYDLRLEFDNSINLYLFSTSAYNGDEASIWILFTPEYKTLSAGSGALLEYEDSGETPLKE